MPLKVVVGLGNVGDEYALTPHNAGFMVVDRIAETAGIAWREEAKFKGQIARIKLSGCDVMLLKPSTYMNLSGESVSKLMHYYGAKPDDLIVVSDDADLPVGKIRIRSDGGAGGHRGLLSVFEHCGTQDFARVRIGIGRARHGSLAQHVLGRLPEEDEKTLQRSISVAAEAVGRVITRGIAEAMNSFNGGNAQQTRTAESKSTELDAL